MVRIVGSIVAGTIAAFAAMVIVEFVGHLLFPLPAETASAPAAPRVPLAAAITVILAWLVAPPAGSWVARGFGAPRWSAWLIALLVAGAAIFNIMLMPYPAWVEIAAIVAPVLGGLAASHGLAWTDGEGSG